MALEKNLFAIAPVLFTTDGGADGKVTLANACNFKVKQKVKVAGTGLELLDLEVKRIINDSEMYLGPQTGPISDRTDLSAYTTAASSFVYAIEQKRPSIPFEESTRAVYEEEPTVAYRSILVDKCGDFYATDNPLPVQLSDGSINIGTVNAELEVQLSHLDDDPDAGDVHDSVRIGDGDPGEYLKINPDGSINVNATIGPSGTIINTYGDVSSVASSTTTTVVSYTTPIGKTGVLHRVEYGGENIAVYDVEVNSVLIARRRTYFNGPMSDQFDFGLSNGIGVDLVAGDVVRLRVTHYRPLVADFEGRIEVLES